MDLDEFTIAVLGADLKTAAGGAAGAGHRHRRTAVNQSGTTTGDDHRVGGECADFHRDEILPDGPAAHAVVIQHWPEKIPELELADLALGLPAANLFIQGIQKLLACRCTGERRSLEERAAK